MQEEEYEVEAIKNHRLDIVEQCIEFEVKWKNYPESDNTWEQFNFFTQDQPEMVEEYMFNFFDKDGNIVSISNSISLTLL